MIRAYEKFLEHPTRQNYLAVRQRLMADPDWPPPSRELDLLADSVRQGAWRAVQSLVDAWSPLWALCPRAHFWLARFFESREDADQFSLSRFETVSCMEGLLATGDGTRKRPWIVTYRSDVADCLAVQDLRATEMALEVEAQRTVLRVAIAYGQTKHFIMPTIPEGEPLNCADLSTSDQYGIRPEWVALPRHSNSEFIARSAR